jgi:hypothetical protein
MAIHIRMRRDYTFDEKQGGDPLILPRLQVLTFDDDYVGLLAIQAGAAEPAQPLTDEQTFRLRVITAAKAGDEEALKVLMAEAENESATAPDPAPVAPAPKKRGKASP